MYKFNWKFPKLTVTSFVILTVAPLALFAGPIHDAAKTGNLAEVEKLLASGVDINEKDAGFHTALYWASDAGNLEIMRLLIKNGADVNAQNLTGRTPIMGALLASQGALLAKQRDAVRLLIESGANVNLADDDKTTALDDAVRLNQSEVVDMLIKAGGKCGDNFNFSKDCKARKE